MFGAGCAKDRTIDDWRRQRVNEQLALIRSVATTYRGTMNAVADGTPFSTATVSVDGKTRTSDARDRPGAEVQAVLRINVTLEGDRPLTLTFEDGAMDPSSMEFKAATQVEGRGHAEIEGTFVGGRMSGRLEASGYPAQGVRFELDRVGGDGQASFGPGGPDGGKYKPIPRRDDEIFHGYSAMAKFSDGETSRVSMTIGRSENRQEEDFIETLMPFRVVDVIVSLGPFKEALINGATWDRRTRSLIGEARGDGGAGQAKYHVKLDCREALSGGGRGWDCRYYSMINAAGLIFAAVFEPTESPEGGAR
jgi:hypothetical protein